MNPKLPRCPLLLAALCGALLSGCASQGQQAALLYDFGALPVSSGEAVSTIPPLVVTDVSGSSLLDSPAITYRLNYADPLQARAYANSRWSSTPLQLLTQRITTRIAQAGVKVLAVTDATAGALLLRIDADAFSQNFDSPSQSKGEVVLRVSAFRGHTLVDQRSFAHSVSAASADAAGGVRALAAATDATAADILQWLAALPPPKQ